MRTNNINELRSKHSKLGFSQTMQLWSFHDRKFENLRRLLQQKRRIKIELSAKCLIRDYSMLVIYEIGEVYFRLLGTNGFMQRQKMDDWLLRPGIIVRTSNMKISRCHLAD